MAILPIHLKKNTVTVNGKKIVKEEIGVTDELKRKYNRGERKWRREGMNRINIGGIWKKEYWKVEKEVNCGGKRQFQKKYENDEISGIKVEKEKEEGRKNSRKVNNVWEKRRKT